MDLLKLLHGFVKVVLLFWSKLLLNESTYSMPWVCCAFGNFSWKLTLSVISMLISGQAVSKCTTAPPTSATGKARFEKPNILFRFAFCCFQQSSAQQLIIEKQATSGEQEHHLCEALLPPRLSNLHHNWGERLASEHWVVNLLKLMKRFTTSPTPSPSTGASRRECSSTQCLERWWLRCVTKRLVTLIVIAPVQGVDPVGPTLLLSWTAVNHQAASERQILRLRTTTNQWIPWWRGETEITYLLMEM